MLEYQIEFKIDVGISSVPIAFLKLSNVACFAIHVIDGSIKSFVVIIDLEIISKIGSKKMNPIQINTK